MLPIMAPPNILGDSPISYSLRACHSDQGSAGTDRQRPDHRRELRSSCGPKPARLGRLPQTLQRQGGSRRYRSARFRLGAVCQRWPRPKVSTNYEAVRSRQDKVERGERKPTADEVSKTAPLLATKRRE